MKLLFALLTLAALTQTTFARRGNPVIEDRRLQYIVIDSDDDHPAKPTYAFVDTTFGTWVRVTGFNDPDTGYATITGPALTNFAYGRQNVTLPPKYVLTNGLVIIDQEFPPMIGENHVRDLTKMPNRALNVYPFTMIAPLWTNMELRTTGDSSKVYYRGTADTFYMNFYNMALKGSNGKIRATFQVVFSRLDSSITYRYRSFDGNVDGEQAADVFQRLVTIGMQDTFGRFPTNYLDRGTYYAFSRAANPAQYELNLHNGLAVKFLHYPTNTISIRSIATPSYDGYELPGAAFQPTIRVTQFTDSSQMIYILNEAVNTITGAKAYSRLDSILVGSNQERGYTGPGVSVPCGSYRMTSLIYAPAIGADPWTHDNVMAREFVRLSELPYPHLESFSSLERCSYKIAGPGHVASADIAMRDPAAPYLTGAIVMDRKNAKGQFYRDSAAGDTLTTSFMNLLGKANVWLMFSYQRGLRTDSLEAGIRSRTLVAPELRSLNAGSVIEGDSLVIEALHSLGSTWNPAENRWVQIGAIVGGIDLETKKFRVQVPSNCVHNHSRFRIRLAATEQGPFLGLPFDDEDSYVIDGLQIVSPQASKTSTDLEPTGLTLGAKYYNHIPRDVKVIKPIVRVASNGMQATLAVYQVKLILRDQLGREVYNKRQSLVAPSPRTDVEVELPEWQIEGSQGGVFAGKVIIEQMFNDYYTANDTNTFYRLLNIDDVYAFDDGQPDTVGTMTAAHTPYFYTFKPLRTDSLRGMEFFHLSATGMTNWVFTFRDASNNARYVRSITYDVLERGFHRAMFSTPVLLSTDSTYIIECNMSQGFGLGGDASLGLVIPDNLTTTPHFTFIYPQVLGAFSDNVSGAYNNATAPKNASAGGPILPMMHLIYRGSSTFLPVELVSLRAKRTAEGSVAIDFATAEESELLGFTIERFGNTSWEAIANITAKNSRGAAYFTLDSNAPRSEVRYRLIAHDLDGSSQVLGTVALGPSASSSPMTLRPNPASDYVQLTLPSINSSMHGAIYDATGRQVRSFDGTNSTIDVRELAEGMYLVEVLVGSERYRAKLWINPEF